MKELSIEEKAKRYDEAIKRGLDYIRQTPATEMVTRQSILEHIFPELKESEDEKIRKKVIDILKLNVRGAESQMQASRGVDRTFEVYACNKVIAWLEKQGEQKPAELSNTCEFSIKTWINIVAYVLKEHNGIGNYLDDPEVKDTAEKLQKRYKFDSASEEWDRVYRKGIDAGVNKGKAIALREKNHAWSEEDEKMFKSAFWHVKNSCGNGGKNSGEFEVYNWLKFLKKRYTWKPSDEQIMALRWILNHIPYDSHKEEVSGLLEQLKKLKGE